MYQLSNWKPRLRGHGQVCCWREAFDHVLTFGISWCCTTKVTLAGAPVRALCWTSFKQLCRADRPCTPKAALYSKLGGFQVNPSLRGPRLFASSALGLDLVLRWSFNYLVRLQASSEAGFLKRNCITKAMWDSMVISCHCAFYLLVD